MGSQDHDFVMDAAMGGLLEVELGRIAAQKGMNRSTLRGTLKVNIQWKLYCIVNNLEKIAHFSPLNN